MIQFLDDFLDFLFTSTMQIVFVAKFEVLMNFNDVAFKVANGCGDVVEHVEIHET